MASESVSWRRCHKKGMGIVECKGDLMLVKVGRGLQTPGLIRFGGRALASTADRMMEEGVNPCIGM